MDFNSLLDQAKKAWDDGLQTVQQQAIPALTISLEKWGADVLNQQAQQTQSTLNATVASQPPAQPNTLSYYLQGTVKDTVGSAYAIPIALACVFVGFLIFSKR